VSPSFDLVAKVPSSPRDDYTRAQDQNETIRSETIRVPRKDTLVALA